jgi:hypothetical protein
MIKKFSILLILISIFHFSFGNIYSNKFPNFDVYYLETGTYKSKSHPGETIFYSMDMGRNWSVTYVTWIKNGIKKEYILPINQTNGLGNSERLIIDKKNSNILRLKVNPNRIIINIIGEKTFKTEDGSEWNFISDDLPIVN